MPARRTTLRVVAAGLAAGGLLEGLRGMRAARAQTPPAAPDLPYRPHTVRSPDGVDLAVYDYGNPEGQPILLLHGYAQAALSWQKQTGDAALQHEFRLVAVDLRGHGMSGKPEGHEHYRTPQRWANDLQAVIAALSLHRPVLVGWSYAGRVIGDYLTAHGQAAIGGLMLVCATIAARPGFFGPGVQLIGPMTSADPLTAIRGTQRFLEACFEIQPTPDEMAVMLGFNMMVPRHVRISLGGRQAEYDQVLRAVRVPTVVYQGLRDRLIAVPMAQHAASLIEGSRLILREGIGHAPFWEEPLAFNAELAALARRARG